MIEDNKIKWEELENVEGGLLGTEKPKFATCEVCGSRLGILALGGSNFKFICHNEKCPNYFFKK